MVGLRRTARTYGRIGDADPGMEPANRNSATRGRPGDGRLIVRRIPHFQARIFVRPDRTAGSTSGRSSRSSSPSTPAILDTVTADKIRRRHAIIEQIHADLNNSALAHMPSVVRSTPKPSVVRSTHKGSVVRDARVADRRGTHRLADPRAGRTRSRPTRDAPTGRPVTGPLEAAGRCLMCDAQPPLLLERQEGLAGQTSAAYRFRRYLPMFIRFVVGTDDENHRPLTGIITELRLLRDESQLYPYEEEWLEEIYDWFNANLP